MHSPSTRKCCTLLIPINLTFVISSPVLSLQDLSLQLFICKNTNFFQNYKHFTHFSQKSLHDSEIIPTFAASINKRTCKNCFVRPSRRPSSPASASPSDAWSTCVWAASRVPFSSPSVSLPSSITVSNSIQAQQASSVARVIGRCFASCCWVTSWAVCSPHG